MREDLRLNIEAIQKLAERGGPATETIRYHARSTRDEAKARARRSKRGSHGRAPGYLASRIEIREGEDDKGFYADVVTEARTPKGFPYGSMVELLFPYLLTGSRRVARTIRKAGQTARVKNRRKRKKTVTRS